MVVGDEEEWTMPLKIELKPGERLIINGAAIRNGDRRATFIVETHCRFLREGEIIRESDADTPCKRLCHLLQVIYLAEDRAEPLALHGRLSAEILAAAPSTGPLLLAIQSELGTGRYHHAIKRGRELVAHEAALLARAA